MLVLLLALLFIVVTSFLLASVFTHNSSYCVLAIAVLSVCLSHGVDQPKTVQARITKFSPSAAWKTLVSGTIKRFHKFEKGHPEQRH